MPPISRADPGPLSLAILAAHSFHAPIIRMVRGNLRRQPLYGGQRLLRTRVGSVGNTVVSLAVDLHAVDEKLGDRQLLRYSKQEVFQEIGRASCRERASF